MEAASRFNAGEALLARARARGDAPLLRCEGAATSGLELDRQARALQAALAAHGLAPGDRVLLLLLDRPAFQAAFLGALRGGFVPIPVSTQLPVDEVAFIARDAQVRASLVDRALPDELAASGPYPPGAWIARLPDAADAGPEGPEAPEAADTRAGDAAFWLYTSGTTGRPKGAIHRHLDLPFTAESYAREILALGPGDRVLSASKLFFAYGLGNALTFPLWLDAEAVLHPGRPTPEALFALIEREAPTLFFGVPTLYASLLAHPAAPLSLGRVRLCVSAGEALSERLYGRWRERFGVEILDGLGSTEMLHIFLSNRPGAARPGASGRPVPGYRVRIVDEGGADVKQGEVGTLLAYGESAARAYHARPEASAQTMIAPGWLRCGDSYREDEDGFFHHVGRTDDLLKVGAQYVSPLEVEAALASHPAVLEAAVVPDRDADGLVRPRAVVVLRPAHANEPGLADALRQFARQRLAPHKVPRRIEFADALPRTATGKIQRFALR